MRNRLLRLRKFVEIFQFFILLFLSHFLKNVPIVVFETATVLFQLLIKKLFELLLKLNQTPLTVKDIVHPGSRLSFFLLADVYHFKIHLVFWFSDVFIDV